MRAIIRPGTARGTVAAPPSKSMAHRLLICAALAEGESLVRGVDPSEDILATADCLTALGASLVRKGSAVRVRGCDPRKAPPAVLRCRESGSTLRFMIPLCLLSGSAMRLEGSETLLSRPLSVYENLCREHGFTLRRENGGLLVQGRLAPGEYAVPGSISSQFITGLLFATTLMEGNCHINITGQLESKPYVDMTKQALDVFNAPDFHSPGQLQVEGDWSNGAFFVASKSLGNEVNILGLNPTSAQGDRIVVDILEQLQTGMPTVSAADIPDLVPVLAVVAGAKHGAVFTDIRRLRLKESDRVASTIAMIESLGGKAQATDNTLTVYGTGYRGGTVDAVNDHRIAMAAAIASTVCREPIAILGAQCVQKSYPTFWEEFKRLGGKI